MIIYEGLRPETHSFAAMRYVGIKAVQKTITCIPLQLSESAVTFRIPSWPVAWGRRITDGPKAQRSRFKSAYAFSYCAEHWAKHYDIYVYIDKTASKHIVKTAGRAALETVLNHGEVPNRIFIDSSGKIITDIFTSG